MPSLLNNFHKSEIRTRSASLAALSRFFTRTKGVLVKEVYKNLLKESALEKSLIIGAIRSLGDDGESELYRLMKSVKSPKVKALISYYLGFRIPWDQEGTLEITLVSHYNELKHFSPGSLCHYVGDTTCPDFSKS